MSPSEILVFRGSRPSMLRVEWRADGKARLRIEGPGLTDAIVDLSTSAQAELVDTLRAGPPANTEMLGQTS